MLEYQTKHSVLLVSGLEAQLPCVPGRVQGADASVSVKHPRLSPMLAVVWIQFRCCVWRAW